MCEVVKRRTKRALFWLLPPLEAHLANKAINSKSLRSDQEWNSLLTQNIELLSEVKDCDDLEQLETIANEVAEAEAKRKESVEDKAASFVTTVGVAVGVNTVIPLLLINDYTPALFLGVISFLYVVAILCLIVAAFYATKVRQAEGLVTPSVIFFKETVESKNWDIRGRIAFKIARSQWNESSLLKKTNNLAVAEKLFPRGLLLGAFAILIGIMSGLVRV